MKDAFLSEEDFDLRSLSFAELNRVWNAWLRQAQMTNEHDRHDYSHGVFTREPSADRNPITGTEQEKRPAETDSFELRHMKLAVPTVEGV